MDATNWRGDGAIDSLGVVLVTKIAAVMGEDERSRIANAGVETGANKLDVSVACCTFVRRSKAQANAKRLVLLMAEHALANS